MTWGTISPIKGWYRWPSMLQQSAPPSLKVGKRLSRWLLNNPSPSNASFLLTAGGATQYPLPLCSNAQKGQLTLSKMMAPKFGQLLCNILPFFWWRLHCNVHTAHISQVAIDNPDWQVLILWFYMIFTGWTKIDGLAFFKQSPHRNPLLKEPRWSSLSCSKQFFSHFSVNDSSKELEMLMKLMSGKRQRGKQTFEGISGFSSQEQLIFFYIGQKTGIIDLFALKEWW